MPGGSTGDEKGLERLLVFGDAVVAIAITLVVLPLVDAAQDLDGVTAGTFLREHRVGLGSAALSFVVIWALWRPQHRVFERATGYTPGVAALHMLWLAAIVFLPLPTLLLVSSPPEDRSAYALYIGTMLVSMVAGRLEYGELGRAGLLRDPQPTWRSWLSPAAVLVALGLAMIPGVTMWGLLLLVPASWIEGRLATRPA